MHSITLDAAAGALLLSGILCLGLLFKRTPSSRLGSSASVLSISDMSSTLLTSLVLLLHRFYLEPDNALVNNDVRLLISPKGSRLLHESSNSSSTAAEEDDCDFKAVFLQYAVFLVPFANAFVSLLGFSTSCYTGTSRIERRCSLLEATSSSAIRLDDQTNVTVMTEQPKKRSFPAGRRLYGTGLAILSQWLLPALFSGAFQLAEHRRIELANHTMDELACTLAANFPFENCAEDLFSAPEILNVIDPLGSSSSVHNYVSSEDNLLWPSPNSSETHELVSRIYAIVQTALNDSLIANASRPASQRPQLQHYNISQLLDASALLNSEAQSSGRGRLMKSRVVDSHRFFINDEEEALSNRLQVYRCAKNRCVVSTRFLQVQLFLFLSLVYFLPILASALLLVASHYKCREIGQKLKDCQARHESTANEDASVKPQEPGISQVQKNEDDACARFAEEACELTCETERMQSFYQVFKVNVMLAVALWTPFFLQVISKTFFCSNVPGWLMEIAYLATIVFGIFRNALNLTVAKIDAEAEESKKHNSVHPN